MENMYLISKGIELGASQHRKNQRNQQNHQKHVKSWFLRRKASKTYKPKGKCQNPTTKHYLSPWGKGINYEQKKKISKVIC